MKLLFLDVKPSTVSVALSLVLISGCVTTKPDPQPWSADKNLVIQSLQDAHVDNAKLKKQLDILDKRILDLERLNAEQQTKLAMLEAAIEKQKIVNTKQKHPLSSKKATSLNQRLDALAAAAPLPAKPIVAKNNSVIGKAKKENVDEKNAYTAAYLALKSGRYDEASSGFVKVIKAHPKGEYTDQAYYWLGESLVALLRNPEALEAFTVVANQYPKSTKHAAALMKMAAVYKSMKYYDRAKSTLQRVLKKYPNGKTAERARAELKALPSAQNSTGAKK
jgi:tol-pal system protein YbgF